MKQLILRPARRNWGRPERLVEESLPLGIQRLELVVDEKLVDKKG